MKALPINKTLILSITALMLFSVSLLAQPKGECGGHGKKGHHGMKELNLTEEQKTKLQELKVNHKPAMVKVKESIKLIKQKSKEELLKDKPDKAVLKKYSQEIAEQFRISSDEMVNHLLQVKEILTKEQFEKMLSKNFRHGFNMKGDCGGQCKGGKCKDGKKGGKHGGKGGCCPKGK